MKPQYHVSGIELMSMCGVAFQHRYLDRKPEPRSVAMVVGSAVDRAVSADEMAKVETGSLLAEEAVRDLAHDALVDEWKNGTEVKVDGATSFKNELPVAVSEEDADDGWTPGMGDAIDASVDLAAFHHRVVAPTLCPTHVQRKWVLDVEGLDIQVAGAIDIQQGLVSINDTKTSAKSPQKDLADKSLQLSMYALAVYRMDGAFPRFVQLNKIVRTPKRKDLKYVPLQSTRGPENMPHLLARIEAAANTVQSGVFTPADLNHWKCSERYCGFWNVCRYSRRPVSVAVK